MDIIPLLSYFNLTNQEAKIYVALFAENPLTGYEVAKLTGISRSNAYMGLAGLVEKGGAYLLDGNPARYTPVPPEEFCGNVILELEGLKKQVIEHFPREPVVHEGYITIQGEKNILKKMATMILGTTKRLYIAVAPKWISLLEEELKMVSQQGKKVVLLTEECCNYEGMIFFPSHREEGQIRLIVDSSYVLTGDMEHRGGACLFSREKNLVELFKESMKNEIRLIQLEREKQS